MTSAIRAKKNLQADNESCFFQIQQRSDFFSACEKGCLKKVKKFLNTSSDYICIKNEEGLSVLEVAILNKQSAIVDYLFSSNRDKVFEILKENPQILFLAIEQEMVNFVEFTTSEEQFLLQTKNADGENLFFSACRNFNLRLMKHFFRLNPKLIKNKNNHKETPFSFLALSKDRGSSHLAWMIEKTSYQISCSEEALAFHNHLRSNLFFNEDLIPKVVNQQTLPDFLSCIYSLLRAVKSRRVSSYIKQLLEPYPDNFYYELQQEEVLEGDDLIRFCNEAIPEETSVQNPFTELYRLFLSIKKVDYVAQMSFGTHTATVKEVRLQKIQDLKECRALFQKVKGETDFRKNYLIKILKHLAHYLDSEQGSKERIIFLKDLTAASPHCYTHYSTILRSIYSRISGDIAFGVRQSESDNEANLFQRHMAEFLKRAFCRKLRQIHGSMNIHCQFLVQKFLREENYPLAEEPIVDEELNLTPTLLLFRQERLGIRFEEESEALIHAEDLFYQDTKQRYMSLLNDNILNLHFIYLQTMEFLIEGLSSEQSSIFLSHLTSWLENQKISAHSVLRLNEKGEYIIKKVGVLEMLSRLPKKIVL